MATCFQFRLGASNAARQVVKADIDEQPGMSPQVRADPKALDARMVADQPR